MMHEKHRILAFDIEDAKKISKHLKNKKKEILAITPNAFEILKNDKFENIIAPHEINKNIHEELAEDNIKFREKLNKILSIESNNNFCNESFKNMIAQCFSTLNFFLKFLKKDVLYYSFLNNKFELSSREEVYNKLLNLIILRKYGIFKIINNNNFKLFYFKKTINDILFFFLKKRKIILNFLGNKKKLSFSNNLLEITFENIPKSKWANYYLIGKNFIKFFFKNNVKTIYPEINYKEDLEFKKKIDHFLSLLDFDAFNVKNEKFINFIYEVILYENEMQKFLYKRLNNLSLKYFITDHLSWMNTSCLGSFFYKKNLPVFLSSHGNIDLISDNNYEKNELLSHANGLCYSKYASNVIAQTPSAFEISKKFLEQNNFNIIKSHPIAYYGQRPEKKIENNKINILFAGTYKVFLSRPYIYQGSFEFMNTIKKLLIIFRSLKNVNLVFNIRTNDEIDNLFLKKLVKKDLNIKMIFNGNIEALMQNSQLLITNFSTLLDEYSYLNRPIVMINDHLKFECYKHFYSNQNENDSLKPIYYLNSEECNKEIINILQKIRKNVKINKPKHIWNNDEAMNKETLIKKINEL